MDWESGVAPVKGCLQSAPANLNKKLDLSNLKDKVVLITGGASGFGAAVARKAAANGAHLMIGDINTKLGEEMIANLRQLTSNNSHQFFHCNVTEWSSQASFFKQASEASPHGGIDVVIANAGIADVNESALFEAPPDYSKIENPVEPNITRTLDINLRGVFFTTHLALSYLNNNPGSVSCSQAQTSFVRDRQLILVSSMAGITALPTLASYTAAKHGVVGLFRCLRMTAPQTHGIRVNMINPYFAATALLNVAGQAMMAGSDMAKVDAVVDVMIRFMTDPEIIGRGIVVAPEGTAEQAEVAKLEHGGPAWDVYAEDFTMTDIFVRRVIAVTNLKVKAKGWYGFFSDLSSAFSKPIRKVFSAKES